MASYQADTTFVPVMPSFRGFGQALTKGTQAAAGSAGSAAGKAFGRAFGPQAAAGAGNVEALQKRLAASVEASSKKVKAARSTEEDAARRAVIEETKLQELRGSGKAKASALLQAEDRLARAQKVLARAQDGTRKATQDADDALHKQTTELKAAEDASKRTGSAFARLRSGLGRGLFRGVSAASAAAGSDAGQKFARGFSAGTANLASVAKRGIGGITKVAAGGALAVGALGVAGAGAGLKIAASMETAKIGFTTMLGSGKKADAFLRDLQRFAATTPFEFPELQTAASSLISAGVEAKDVIPIMRTLGDATAGMGTGSEGIQRATVALQQMNAAGRITGEDLNQLRDAGIPVYDLLAKATGKSKAEVVKLAGAGKLGKKELDQLMKALSTGKGLERFNGLMAKSSKSLSGLFSTLKDNLGQGLANAITPAIPALKSGIAFVSDGLGSLFRTIARNKDSIGRIFSAAGRILKSFGRIAAASFGPFVESLTGGRKGLKGFADFLETHQEQFVSTFIAMTRGAIQFGKGLAAVLSAALHGFAFVEEGTARLVSFSISGFQLLLRAAADAFGWIPGVGPLLETASTKFDAFAQGAINGMKDAAATSEGFANTIDDKMVPALDAAEEGLDKVASIQLNKAHLRDEAVKAAQAIKGIGTEADGSQIKLKKWADRTKLGSDAQQRLRDRIGDARKALKDQLRAVEAAEGGQKQLTKAWETGRDRLFKEFKQMGLSNKEAKKLADRYAGIKPKVQTKFTQPGMAAALHDTTLLDRKIDGIKSQNVGITFSTNASKVAGTLKKLRLGGAVRKPKPAPSQPPSQMVRDGGEIVGRGGPRQDNIAGIDKATGLQTAWVSAKEFVVNAAAYARNKALVQAINAGKKIYAGIVGQRTATVSRRDGGEIPGHAGGGPVVTLKYGRIPRSALEIPDVANSSSSEGAFQTGLKLRRYGVTSLQKLLDAARARQAAKAGGGNGGYHGPVGAGASGIIRIARSFHPSYIAGHRDPQGGPAFDIGSSGRKNTNIGNALRSNHGKLGLRYVIRQMQITSARSSWNWRRYTPITNAGDFRHVAHVHVSYGNGGEVRAPRGPVGDLAAIHRRTYDTGGSLPPGLTLAYNGTGKTETVLRRDQLAAMTRRQTAGRSTSIKDNTFYNFTPRDLFEQARAEEARDAALFGAWVREV